MELFAWDPRYLTGESMIDREHQGLFALINRVAGLSAEKASTAAVQEIVDELVRYAQVHFRHEEVLMMDAGCASGFIEAHVSAHREFADQVAKMCSADACAVDTEYLLRFLSSWLAYHILGMDQAMARQIRKIRDGVRAVKAYEDERQIQPDPATASLLAAMRGLYGVVMQRNEALQGYNQKLDEQVRARTRELASANELLEADIRQRERAERALQERNAELEALNARLAEMGTQLLQAERLASVGQLAAGVAHEINNPISFVLSNFGALDAYLKNLLGLLDAWEQSSGTLPPNVAEARRQFDLDYIRQDAPVLIHESRAGLARVKKIVQDLRDFSSVDRALDWGWGDLSQCLETTLGLLGPTLGKLEIKRSYAELPEIWCQPAQIRQVLHCLLSNAVEAMPSGGVLTLCSACNAQQVWLEISDTGKGIAAEALPKIFDPFYTTKPLGTGNGMGLALAYGIVRKHRGQIDVACPPGGGTCVRVTLPIGAPHAE